MAFIKGCNPQNLLQLSMLDFLLMLRVKIPVVNTIHQSNQFATGEEN